MTVAGMGSFSDRKQLYVASRDCCFTCEALPPIIREYVPQERGPKPVPEFVVKAGAETRKKQELRIAYRISSP